MLIVERVINEKEPANGPTETVVQHSIVFERLAKVKKKKNGERKKKRRITLHWQALYKHTHISQSKFKFVQRQHCNINKKFALIHRMARKTQ